MEHNIWTLRGTKNNGFLLILLKILRQ